MGHDSWERNTPPENEEDWATIWRGIHRANEGWAIVGPVSDAVRNWKAWAVASGLVVYLNRLDIVAILQAVVGGQ